MTIRKIRCSWVSLLLFWCVSATTASAQDVFVRPTELEPAIAFWRSIYTSVGTDGGVLHDPEELDVVYEVMKFPANISPRERTSRIDAAKKKYARILERLALGTEGLNSEEARVAALWPKNTRRVLFLET